MADEPSDAKPSTKTGSTKNFAVKVFKETSVAAVSTILSTSSIPRKIFRVVVFSAFTAGFLTQCILFLGYLLEHPTVLDINIIRPDSYMLPAYTFCNRNKVKRSKFCQKYPEHCVVPDENFCKKFPRYCGEHRLPMPKLEITDEEIPSEDMFELGHDIGDLYRRTGNITVTGPLPIVGVEEDFSVFECYSINSRVESPLDLIVRIKSQDWYGAHSQFVFNPEENETFNPGSKSGIVFAIDSPFNPVNPFHKGIIMKPGNLYKIFIHMHEEKLLPYPYKTDCVDYVEKWLENNRMGHRSQKACKELCLQQFIYSCINCSIPMNGYESGIRICTKEDIYNSKSSCGVAPNPAHSLYETCTMDCKEECLKMKYLYQVQEIRMTPRWTNDEMDMHPRNIKVQIRFEDSEIVAMHYRPQYQDVEAFSYIGGFIGIWLGVSLVQVADILESLFRIARYFVKRKIVSCFESTMEKKLDGN